MTNTEFSAIVLAAGRGTRMKSHLPKVLHPIAGEPMIFRVIKSLQALNVKETRLVVGHGEALVRQVVQPHGVNCYRQENQLGTADAVRAADPHSLRGNILIVNGDHPLIDAKDLKLMLQTLNDTKAALVVGTAILPEPNDFGRIVRQKNQFKMIVEAKDASADTLAIQEVNTGLYAIRSDVLNKYLPRIQNQNAKQEYYFTDIVSLLIEDGERVETQICSQDVAHGVNNQVELSRASKKVFLKKAEILMEAGVLMIDPDTTYIEESVEVGASAVIYPNVYLKGKTKIGSFSVVEPNCFILDSQIGESVQVRAGCYIEKSIIANKASVGPYARLRPDTEIGNEAHVGNFVEMKKVKFGDRSKAGHLTYLGDATVGTDTNIGCGTITCNYAVDKKKYRTEIGSHVFVGSDTQFVAPLTVGDRAVIGSGSTITKDVPANALAVARGKQIVKENYISELDKKSESSES